MPATSRGASDGYQHYTPPHCLLGQSSHIEVICQLSAHNWIQCFRKEKHDRFPRPIFWGLQECSYCTCHCITLGCRYSCDLASFRSHLSSFSWYLFLLGATHVCIFIEVLYIFIYLLSIFTWCCVFLFRCYLSFFSCYLSLFSCYVFLLGITYLHLGVIYHYFVVIFLYSTVKYFSSGVMYLYLGVIYLSFVVIFLQLYFIIFTHTHTHIPVHDTFIIVHFCTPNHTII